MTSPLRFSSTLIHATVLRSFMATRCRGLSAAFLLALFASGSVVQGQVLPPVTPAGSTPVVVVVLGASTAAGKNLPEGGYSPADCWVNRYAAYLQVIRPGSTVVNLAVSGTGFYESLPTGTPVPAGRESPDPLHNITKALTYHPTVIIVNYPGDHGYGVDTAVANARIIQAAATAAGVPIWFCNAQPAYDVAANPSLIALRREQRDKFNLAFGACSIDFWTPLAEPPPPLPDGSGRARRDLTNTYDDQHPNAEGHRLLFEAVKASALVGNVPPLIMTSPAAQSVIAGSPASFAVAVSGAPAPGYQWQRLPAGSSTWANVANGGGYSGVATATLTVGGTSLAMNGDQFRCTATNSSGAATSAAALLSVSPASPVAAALRADFDGDGKPDLIWSNSITGERALWLMSGTQFIAASTLGIFPLEWTVAATGDFNFDGKPDLVWSNSITGERALWLMNGTSLLGTSTLGIFPLEWTVAATGDFNLDGKPDLVWSNRITGERALWLMNGTSLLGTSTLGVFPLEWTVAATGDFNFDGKPDLVWSNSITGERALWLMAGTQFIAASTLGTFPLEWTVAGVGDYDGDGKPDLIWSNSLTGERALWLMNGTQFIAASTLGIFPLEWTVGN